MPGSPRFPARSDPALAGILACLVIAAAGCGGPAETGKKEIDRPPARDTDAGVESAFDPRRYGVPVETLMAAERLIAPRADTAAPPAVAAQSGTIPGFRVQVLFTQEIDRANGARDTLSVQLAGQRVYIVFESPYYKVRVGDFQERPEAQRAVQLLVARGYADAWVVPDQVFKNPAPLQLPPPPEPDHGE